VNVVLVGTLQQLREAFAALGWSEADRLSLASSWDMIRAFVLNAPYPTAPFSTLYLFGRGQDIGFQKAIDNSPRKRHHIRFWALSQKRARAAWGTADFWLNTERPPDNESVLWIGAGTRSATSGISVLWTRVSGAGLCSLLPTCWRIASSSIRAGSSRKACRKYSWNIHAMRC
jgi:LssY C-terminus